jgi:hypothetical protein
MRLAVFNCGTAYSIALKTSTDARIAVQSDCTRNLRAKPFESGEGTMTEALTIESFWKAFCARQIARGISQAQLQASEAAFYSGAVAMYDIMMIVTDPDFDPMDARVILAALYDEREEFLRIHDIAAIDR